MNAAKAIGKDVVPPPGDDFDAFVDFLFNAPSPGSRPTSSGIEKASDDVVASTTDDDDAAKRAPPAATTTAGDGSRDPSRIRKEEEERRMPSGRAHVAAAAANGRDYERAELGEEKEDDDLCRRSYPFKLTPSYLEFLDNANRGRRGSSGYEYSDAPSNASEMGGNSSAWSFSAVGRDDDDDDTRASFTREEDFLPHDDANDAAFVRMGDIFPNAMNFDEKAAADDGRDGPVGVVVGGTRPYFLNYSSSYLSERSDREDDGYASSTWSFSAVGAE
jgi:hypothetical protein